MKRLGASTTLLCTYLPILHQPRRRRRRHALLDRDVPLLRPSRMSENGLSLAQAPGSDSTQHYTPRCVLLHVWRGSSSSSSSSSSSYANPCLRERWIGVNNVNATVFFRHIIYFPPAALPHPTFRGALVASGFTPLPPTPSASLGTISMKWFCGQGARTNLFGVIPDQTAKCLWAAYCYSYTSTVAHHPELDPWM